MNIRNEESEKEIIDSLKKLYPKRTESQLKLSAQGIACPNCLARNRSIDLNENLSEPVFNFTCLECNTMWKGN